MATLTHLCGFEEGGYSDGPFGVGVHAYADVGSATGLTWDSSLKRNGVFSLKTISGSGLYQYMSATAHVVGSIWFRWNGLSGDATVVQFYNGKGGIKVSSAGVVSASAGGAYTSGPTVAADTWHYLEWYWNGSANPWVLKWRVNGSAQTDVTRAVAASTVEAVVIGFTEAVSGTVWFDDWAMSVTGGDYPLGPIAVESLHPTGDGTHQTYWHFEDESDVESTGTGTYIKVVPTNQADFWTQKIQNGASYLEWTLPNTTRTNPILGVSASCAVRKGSAFGDSIGAVKIRADGADGTIYSGDFGYGGWFGRSALFLVAPSTAAWTPTIINGTTIRFGYASEISPSPEIEMAVVEVAWDDDPDESGPASEPTPDPGIWVSWDGTGNFDGASDNITADVISMSWSRGASFDHVSAAGPGNATIVVQNSTGKYNPDNTGGTLYGSLTPNRPVWGGAVRTTGALTGGGTGVAVRGFFGGYITEIVPTPVPGANPTAELLCEDALGTYRRATATVSPSQDISRGEFRQSVLTSIGEDVDRRDLESEADMLPFASADTRDALSLLEDLNRSNSSRHYIAPADTKEEWYAYTAINRLHKLTSAADEAWNADDITQLSGYRVTNDTINNLQRATVSPINFGNVNEVVWTATPLPLAISTAQPITLWAEFADYVFGAAVQANSTGGTLSTTITNFGTSAKLELTATGSLVNVTALDITGSSLRRGDLQTVRSEGTASQATYGIRAGGDVSTDLIGQPGAAKAVTDYLVWKFDDPLKRPTVTIAGKGTATMASILDRDLFDVVTLTVDRLNVTAKRFEIIGLRGQLTVKAANVPHYEVSYELQETPNQAPVDYFVIDEDSINGAALIAPF